MAEPETFSPHLWAPHCMQNLDILLLRSLLPFPSPPRISGRVQRHGRINMELQNTGMFTPCVGREFQVLVPNLLQVCSLVQSGDSSHALPSHPEPQWGSQSRM